MGRACADCFVVDCAPTCPVIYNVLQPCACFLHQGLFAPSNHHLAAASVWSVLVLQVPAACDLSLDLCSKLVVVSGIFVCCLFIAPFVVALMVGSHEHAVAIQLSSRATLEMGDFFSHCTTLVYVQVG